MCIASVLPGKSYTICRDASLFSKLTATVSLTKINCLECSAFVLWPKEERTANVHPGLGQSDQTVGEPRTMLRGATAPLSGFFACQIPLGVWRSRPSQPSSQSRSETRLCIATAARLFGFAACGFCVGEICLDGRLRLSCFLCVRLRFFHFCVCSLRLFPCLLFCVRELTLGLRLRRLCGLGGLPFPGPARPLSVAPSVSKVTE